MDKETKKEFQTLTKIITKSFDVVEKRFNGIENRLGGVETKLTCVEKEITSLKTDVKRIEKKTNDIYTLIDGYMNAQEGFKQEFEVMKYKMTKIQEVIKNKLGIEI